MDFCKVEFNYFLEFAKLRALRAFVSYVPSRLTRLRALRAFVPSRLCALRAFAPYVPWFLHALLTRFAHLICYLSALLTRDVHSSQVVSVFSESIISMNLCLLLLYLSSLSLFNRDLNRGCLVYMFLCVFQEVNFWKIYGGNFVYVEFFRLRKIFHTQVFAGFAVISFSV